METTRINTDVQTPEHDIELVLRFRTNMTQGELDEFLCHASERLFSGVIVDIADWYVAYIPEGSHWRDTTYVPGVLEQPFDPAARNLPGGNQLGPGRQPTPVPEYPNQGKQP